MTTTSPSASDDPGSLTAWLTSRSDADLVALVSARPDLVMPAPPNLRILASRAEQRHSVLRAADDLNFLALVIIEHLALEQAHLYPVPRSRIHELIGKRAPKRAVDAALNDLTRLALIWGDKELRLVANANAALPWPIGEGADSSFELSEAEIRSALGTLAPPEKSVLQRLAYSVPIGRTRDASEDASMDRPIPRLLSLGLLRRVDDETVVLPPAVGQVLRGEPLTEKGSLAHPTVPLTKHAPADVAATAGAVTLDLLRHCAGIIDELGLNPAIALRGGGLGVRELRRIAKSQSLDEARVSLLVEVLSTAGLISSGMSETQGELDEMWAPTVTADSWLDSEPAKQWFVLAQAWLRMARRAWLVGIRDATGKPFPALSTELFSAFAARDRRTVLDVLASFDSGSAASARDISRILAWLRPRWSTRFGEDAVGHTIREATELGLIGQGALTPAARALLHGGEAEAEMATALPEPVDYVLVQADLTVIAPGPLTRNLRDRMSLVGDIESAGGGVVYRLSPDSVRRALDSGMGSADLHQLFAVHSKTPVPQALTYLIDDVARRHGQMRVGMAQSFVRCDDPSLLNQVLATPAADILMLRAIAPTVLIAQAPMREVLTALRTAGFVPAGEDAAGAVLDLRSRGARLPARPSDYPRGPHIPSDEQLSLLITDLRAADRAAAAVKSGLVRVDGSRATGAATLALLQLAVKTRRTVSVGYIDAAGVATQRIVEPIAIGGGTFDARDPGNGIIRHFALHRISSVAFVAVS